MTNRRFAEDGGFKSACKDAGIPATRRQASKFRAKVGAAYRNAVDGFKVRTRLHLTK